MTEYQLEFLSLKEATQACLSLHLLKCHIVGNHMRKKSKQAASAIPVNWDKTRKSAQTSDQPDQSLLSA